MPNLPFVRTHGLIVRERLNYLVDLLGLFTHTEEHVCSQLLASVVLGPLDCVIALWSPCRGAVEEEFHPHSAAPGCCGRLPCCLRCWSSRFVLSPTRPTRRCSRASRPATTTQAVMWAGAMPSARDSTPRVGGSVRLVLMANITMMALCSMVPTMWERPSMVGSVSPRRWPAISSGRVRSS